MRKRFTKAVSSLLAFFLSAEACFAALPTPAAASALAGSATVTTISKDGGYAAEPIEVPFLRDAAAPKSNYVRVNQNSRGQTMLGLGGAITESAAYNIGKLSPQQQAEVYEAYFGQSGARYALTRSSIGSADFSTRSYSYDDSQTADPELTNFSIEKDFDYIIPAIKRIQQVNPNVKFFAAPWAPPAWMKKSGKRQGGISTGGLGLFVNNSVLPKYYDSYANYLVKYIQAYAEQGIDVYSLSMQNEVQNNPAWECATWSIDNVISFIGDYLGPALEENGIDTKLVIWDWDKGNDTMHKDGFVNFNTKVLSNEKARQYIDGVAFHWYAGDLWHEISGKPMWSEDFYSLDRVKEKFPEIHLYATEACQEKGAWFGSYEPANRYVHDVLNDFEHGTECFIDWNLVLDANGGPTQGVENNCHAPILLDQQNNICYQPSYHVLKMISRAVQPGTVHIATSTDAGIDKTAVIDKDGTVSLLLGNTGSKAKTVTVVDGARSLSVTLPAYSLTTVSYGPEEMCQHKGQTEVRNAVSETCGTDGYTGDTYCVLCGDRIAEGSVAPATGAHSWDEGTVTKEPTIFEPGEIAYVCTVCSAEKTEELETLTCGHPNTTVQNAVPETCGKDGYSGDTYCTDCGELLSEGQTLPATAEHAWDLGTVTVPPTQTEEGELLYTCTVCGTTRTQVLPVLNADDGEFTRVNDLTNAEAAQILEEETLYWYDAEADAYYPVTLSVIEETATTYLGEDGKTYDASQISTQWTAKNGKTFTAASSYVTDSLQTYTRTHKTVLLTNRYWYVNDSNPNDTTKAGTTAAAARKNFKTADEFRSDGSTGKNASKDDPFYVAAVYTAVKAQTETTVTYRYAVRKGTEVVELASVREDDGSCPIVLYLYSEPAPMEETVTELPEEETMEEELLAAQTAEEAAPVSRFAPEVLPEEASVLPVEEPEEIPELMCAVQAVSCIGKML